MLDYWEAQWFDERDGGVWRSSNINKTEVHALEWHARDKAYFYKHIKLRVVHYCGTVTQTGMGTK